ncbi:MAG: glycoside hydrolase family 88 protein [Terracidiphilus sp.]
MNRRSFLQSAAAISTPLAVLPGAMAQVTRGPVNAHRSESALRIEKAKAAAMSMQRRDWEQGILAQAMLEIDDRQSVILLTKAAIMQRTPDGRLGVVISGSPTDPAMGGVAYAKAAEWSNDAQIHQSVDGLLNWILKDAPRNADGILYHTFHAPEMWSDGLNCAPPFLAAMGFFDEALQQIDGYRHKLWNPDKKLLTHIWDDGNKQLKDASCWGGGNGWAAAGLARVWRSLPSERAKDRARVASFAREIIDGCITYQRADGLFHNVVDQPATFVETNLAQMLAFAIYQGIIDLWLPASYQAHADTMRAAARLKMDADGYVQGACGAPDFDNPGPSTEAQAFCILMEAAGSRMIQR